LDDNQPINIYTYTVYTPQKLKRIRNENARN